jgi:hypothetical protein
MRASLYTGKARSYLIKQNIEYLEIVPGSQRFLKEIVPKIGRMIIPTIETPDGEIIQDSTEIIDFFENDQIPDSLKAILRHAAEDLVPETEATARFFDDWLEAQEDVEAGAILERGLGLCRFEFRGASINALAQPYRIFLLQRLQDACNSMPADDRRSVAELFDENGLGPLLEIRTRRRVERANHREVLGAPAA